MARRRYCTIQNLFISRFYIDCDDMEVGDTVEFAVVCSDRRQTVKAGTKVTKKLRTGVGNSDKGRMFIPIHISQSTRSNMTFSSRIMLYKN